MQSSEAVASGATAPAAMTAWAGGQQKGNWWFAPGPLLLANFVPGGQAQAHVRQGGSDALACFLTTSQRRAAVGRLHGGKLQYASIPRMSGLSAGRDGTSAGDPVSWSLLQHDHFNLVQRRVLQATLSIPRLSDIDVGEAGLTRLPSGRCSGSYLRGEGGGCGAHGNSRSVQAIACCTIGVSRRLLSSHQDLQRAFLKNFNPILNLPVCVDVRVTTTFHLYGSSRYQNHSASPQARLRWPSSSLSETRMDLCEW